MQVFPTSQNPGGYSWPKDILPPQFSPPQFMTQASFEAFSSPVNIAPTQANHQIHREVNELISKSTSLAEAEATLNNAMDATSIFNNDT